METPSPGPSGRPRTPRRASAVLFGAELKAHRDVSGLSQAALAAESGLSTDFVSKMERGLRQPALETMLRLGEVLGVPASSMMAAVEQVWEREP